MFKLNFARRTFVAILSFLFGSRFDGWGSSYYPETGKTSRYQYFFVRGNGLVTINEKQLLINAFAILLANVLVFASIVLIVLSLPSVEDTTPRTISTPAQEYTFHSYEMLPLDWNSTPANVSQVSNLAHATSNATHAITHIKRSYGLVSYGISQLDLFQWIGNSINFSLSSSDIEVTETSVEYSIHFGR